MAAVPTILVIDDEKDLANLLKVTLDAEGFNVIVAHDGEEGLRRAREKPPDLIVLDIRMPGMDGFEVLEHLKDKDDTRAVPVVMFTTSLQESDRKKAYALGADGYVVKSMEGFTLVRHIRKILKSRTEP